MTTVLIVDDRRDAERILARKLTDMGFEVKSLETAVGIVDRLVEFAAEVVIMDMNMPEVDGCEAIKMIRADEVSQKIPVVLCTAHSLPGDRERGVEAGCDAFLEKPIDTDALRTVLADLLCRSSTASNESGLSEDAEKIPLCEEINKMGDDGIQMAIA